MDASGIAASVLQFVLLPHSQRLKHLSIWMDPSLTAEAKDSLTSHLDSPESLNNERLQDDHVPADDDI